MMDYLRMFWEGIGKAWEHIRLQWDCRKYRKMFGKKVSKNWGGWEGVDPRTYQHPPGIEPHTEWRARIGKHGGVEISSKQWREREKGGSN
jgi:hypothetical protein